MGNAASVARGITEAYRRNPKEPVSSSTLSIVAQLVFALLPGLQIVTLTSGKLTTRVADDTTTGIVLPVSAPAPPEGESEPELPESGVSEEPDDPDEPEESDEPEPPEPVPPEPEEPEPPEPPEPDEPVPPEPEVPVPLPPDVSPPGVDPDGFVLPAPLPFAVAPLSDTAGALPPAAEPLSLPPPPQAARIKLRHNAELKVILRIMSSPLTGSDRS